MVKPQNLSSWVDEFLSLLNLDPQQLVVVEGTDPSLPPLSLPSPCSLRYLATHHLDFMSVPRRSFFEFLAHFTSSDKEREKLQEFTSAEGQVQAHALLWKVTPQPAHTHTHTPRRSSTPTAAVLDAVSWRYWKISHMLWLASNCLISWSSFLLCSQGPFPLHPPWQYVLFCPPPSLPLIVPLPSGSPWLYSDPGGCGGVQD